MSKRLVGKFELTANRYTLTAESGSVLIGVLWSLFFLAALALAIDTLITPQLTLAGSLRDRFLLRQLAENGVKRATVELRTDETEDVDILGESWSDNEDAFKEIAMEDGGLYSVYAFMAGEDEEEEDRFGLVDEERKLNINSATSEVLARAFEKIGDVSSQDAEVIADSIVDWRDEDDETSDNGAESPYYGSASPGYACKNGPFEVLEELLLIRGMTQDIFDLVKGHLTVYGEGKVNINTADTLVLQSLGLDASLAEKVISYREGDDGIEATEDDQVFDNAQNIVSTLSASQGLSIQEIDQLTDVVNEDILGVRSDHFLAHTVGRFVDREAESRIDFVVRRNEKIRYWKEN